MTSLFRSGLIIDGILLLILIEALGVILLRKLTRKGPPLPAFLANLSAGACLVLALRAALVEAGWPIIAACLLASLIAHLMAVLLASSRSSEK